MQNSALKTYSFLVEQSTLSALNNDPASIFRSKKSLFQGTVSANSDKLAINLIRTRLDAALTDYYNSNTTYTSNEVTASASICLLIAPEKQRYAKAYSLADFMRITSVIPNAESEDVIVELPNDKSLYGKMVAAYTQSTKK